MVLLLGLSAVACVDDPSSVLDAASPDLNVESNDFGAIDLAGADVSGADLASTDLANSDLQRDWSTVAWTISAAGMMTGPLNALAPFDGNKGYVAGKNVYVTTNAGTSWTRASALPPLNALDYVSAIAVAPDDFNRVVVGTSAGRVFDSSNSGDTWTELKPLVVGVGLSLRELAITKGGRLFARTPASTSELRNGIG